MSAGTALMTIRVVGASLRGDTGRVPLVRVPERLGRHLVRAVRVVRAVGGREAGRITGLSVRGADRRIVVTGAGGGRRVMLVAGSVLTAVVTAVGVVVRVVVRGRPVAGSRLCVSGQQRVVTVRVIWAQGRVQA